MDAETSARMMSGQQSLTRTFNSTSTAAAHHHGCRDCQQFMRLCNGRMTKKDLKYTREEELDKLDLPLTEAEDKLLKLVRLEHNTVDIINENMKLKELLRFASSNLAADLEEARKAARTAQAESKSAAEKLAAAQRDTELKTSALSESQAALQKRKKEMDDLLQTLSEREKTLEESGKYADSLLADKKKLLALIEAKDKKAEAAAKESFSHEQQLSAQKDEFEKIFRDLQGEKKEQAERLKAAAERAAELEKAKAELAAEVNRLAEELRKRGNPGLRADLDSALDQLRLLREERDAARTGAEKERVAAAGERAEANRLRDETAELKRQIEALKKELDAGKQDVINAESARNSAGEKQKEGETRLAKSLSDLEALRKELEDLKKRLADAEKEADDSKRKAADSERAQDDLRVAMKRLEDEVNSRNAELARQGKERENDASQKDKLNGRIKDLEAELLNKRNSGEGNEAERKKFAEELADLRRKLKSAEDAKAELERLLAKHTADSASQLRAKEDEVQARAKTARDAELASAKLQNEVKNSADAYAKIKAELDDLNKRGRLAASSSEELQAQLIAAESARKAAIDHGEELEDQLTKVKRMLDDAKKQINELQSQAGNKEALETLKKDYARQFEAIIRELIIVRKKEGEFLEECAREYFSKMNAQNDDSRFKKTEEQNFGKLAVEFIKELGTDVDGQLEDIKQIIEANEKLENQVAKILSRNQELENKISDVEKRHDQKTDIVGKLVIKNMVLLSEIERLSAPS